MGRPGFEPAGVCVCSNETLTTAKHVSFDLGILSLSILLEGTPKQCVISEVPRCYYLDEPIKFPGWKKREILPFLLMFSLIKERNLKTRASKRKKMIVSSVWLYLLDNGVEMLCLTYDMRLLLACCNSRGYYRCTYRHSRGCLAMKQVQRSDEDPTILDITYRGRHTCVQASRLAATSSPSPINATSNQNEAGQKIALERPKSSGDDAFVAFGEQLEIKSSEDLDTIREHIFPSFAFTATGNENEECNIFLDSMMDFNFLDSLSPSLVSPATSESNYFSCHLNNFGMADNVHTPESDLNDIISTPTSVANSPIDDLDISSMAFAANFPFDSPEFLPD